MIQFAFYKVTNRTQSMSTPTLIIPLIYKNLIACQSDFFEVFNYDSCVLYLSSKVLLKCLPHSAGGRICAIEEIAVKAHIKNIEAVRK